MAKIFEYKDSILGIIHKNKRRIIANFRQNQIRRIKSIILILIFCVSNVFAVENSNINYGEYTLDWYKYEYMYVTYHGVMQPVYEYFYNKNGQRQLAYCLDRGLVGPESKDVYTTDVLEKVKDDKLRMIILNGYPHKSVEELRLNNEHEAIFATQFAIWCYTSGINIYDVLPISDMNNRLVECIHELYNSRNDDPLNHDIDININKKNERLELIDNEINIVCDLEIKGKNINSYTITTKDEYAKVKKDSGKYIIYLPQFVATNGYNVKLDVEFNANENIVLFGTKKQENEQNMAITLSKTFNESLSKQIELETTTTEFKLYKKDIDTNQPIQGAIYKLYSDSGLEYGEFETNKYGLIDVDIPYIEKNNIIVKEIYAPDGYIIDQKEYRYEMNGQKELDVDVYNTHEKGKIKIIKKTKEYNKITNLKENTPLENVEFEVLDSNMNTVEKLVTNKYGECETTNLNTGKYYIKETKTADGYELLKDIIEVQIKDNGDIILVQILNDNIKIDEKLPVTGR